MKSNKKASAGKQTQEKDWAAYYDEHGVLDELVEEEITFSLDEELRAAILNGERRHKLQSITLKLDPIQVQAIKKLATMKAMPYQTLIRTWLAAELKKELHLETA
jgi:predicted DNA binding CopG/RHH family protein